MINAVSENPQTISPGSSVVFDINRIKSKRCQCIQHEEGSTQFELGCNAVYKVEFNANVTSATANTGTALGIAVNGEVLPGTTSYYVPTTANFFNSVSASTLVKVSCGNNKILTIKNDSDVEIIVSNANIVITRIA